MDNIAEYFNQIAPTLSYYAEKTFNYGVAATLWHAIERAFLPIIATTGTVLVIDRIRARNRDAVKATSIVEGFTDFQPTGIRSEHPPFNEIRDMVIHTNSTKNLGIVFSEATLYTPERLALIMQRAANLCTDKKPVPPQHLHEALQSKSRIVQMLPKRWAERFNHFADKDERDEIIDEMARCSRNFRSEQLTPEEARRQKIDPNTRDKRVFEQEKTVWIYQEGAGSNAFSMTDIPEGMEKFPFPDNSDIRIIHSDPDNPVVDPDSHLHDRTVGLKAVIEALDDPVVQKFFTRYPTGEIVQVQEPPPLTEAQLAEIERLNLEAPAV